MQESLESIAASRGGQERQMHRQILQRAFRALIIRHLKSKGSVSETVSESVSAVMKNSRELNQIVLGKPADCLNFLAVKRYFLSDSDPRLQLKPFIY
jgi:hypothetical protein